MAINRSVSGARVGEELEIKFEFTGAECVPGDKWRLSAAGLTLAPATQEIPAGAASPHTLTWKSAAPLNAGLGLTTPFVVELRKEHGAGASLTPMQTFQVTIQPAATAAPAAPAAPAAAAGTPSANPAAPATAGTPATIPQPLQVQVVNAGGPARWFYSAGMVGWLGGLVILLIVLAFLWVVMYVISPTAMNGLGAASVPAGQTTVTVGLQVVTTDPNVALEAAKTTANISH